MFIFFSFYVCEREWSSLFDVGGRASTYVVHCALLPALVPGKDRDNSYALLWFKQKKKQRRNKRNHFIDETNKFLIKLHLRTKSKFDFLRHVSTTRQSCSSWQHMFDLKLINRRNISFKKKIPFKYIQKMTYSLLYLFIPHKRISLIGY